jgi:hypothetical protein
MSNAISFLRIVTAAATLAVLSISAAQANDTVSFRDVLKPNGHERTKSQKFADARACGASGRAHTIRTTMPVFEKCMGAKGWVLDHYTPDRRSRFGVPSDTIPTRSVTRRATRAVLPSFTRTRAPASGLDP